MSGVIPKKKSGSKPCGVIGIDEVGRGPLAGPVTVCAFYIPDESTHQALQKHIFGTTIKDSKKLTKSNRVNIYSTIRQNKELMKNIKYSISSRSAAYIDRFGISSAIRSCVKSCVTNLAKEGIILEETVINLDAGLKVPLYGLKQQDFIKGDEQFLEIALASIMAKVTRDTHMERLAKRHNRYGWENNAGYGTLIHRKAIKTYGVTKYHRMTFLKGFKLFEKPEY